MGSTAMFVVFISMLRIMTCRAGILDTDADGTCNAKLGTCAMNLVASMKNTKPKTAKEECSALKNASDCISNVPYDCANFRIFSKTALDTYNAFCMNPDMAAKLVKLEVCMITNSNSFVGCVTNVPTVGPLNPAYKAQLCKAVKEAVMCLRNTAGRVCGPDGQEVMVTMVRILEPAIKDGCGSGNSVTSFFSLIVAALLALTLFSPRA